MSHQRGFNGERGSGYGDGRQQHTARQLTRKNSWPTAPVTPTMATLGPSATFLANTCGRSRGWQRQNRGGGGSERRRGDRLAAMHCRSSTRADGAAGLKAADGIPQTVPMSACGDGKDASRIINACMTSPTCTDRRPARNGWPGLHASGAPLSAQLCATLMLSDHRLEPTLRSQKMMPPQLSSGIAVDRHAC